MLAIEWLIQQFAILGDQGIYHKITLGEFFDKRAELINKALEMEKQQIINSFNDGKKIDNSFEGETYYIKLFKNQNI